MRLSYPDLHGIARGKEFPASFFDHLLEDGAGYCEAIMTVDLRHNVVAGFEHGFQDIIARPDAATLRRVPWDPEVAVCLADLERMDGSPYGVDSRGVLKRAIAGLQRARAGADSGPELEFYCASRTRPRPTATARYVDNDSHVYTVGAVADPRGILRKMLHAFADMQLGAYAANHEYGRAQYEINLRHSDALDAADRAFLFKDAVKEMAASEGLLATFIGKPWNDDEGSGFHLHISLADESGNNLLNGDGPEGLSSVAHHVIAGLLEHGRSLMAFMNPTTNAYRRIQEEATGSHARQLGA